MSEARLQYPTESPTIYCPFCRAENTVWYNGGELDAGECPGCGARWYGEHVKTDLVFVSEKPTPRAPTSPAWKGSWAECWRFYRRFVPT